jgi:hypothetical protein
MRALIEHSFFHGRLAARQHIPATLLTKLKTLALMEAFFAATAPLDAFLLPACCRDVCFWPGLRSLPPLDFFVATGADPPPRSDNIDE